jgi:hypothetical protein
VAQSEESVAVDTANLRVLVVTIVRTPDPITTAREALSEMNVLIVRNGPIRRLVENIGTRNQPDRVRDRLHIEPTVREAGIGPAIAMIVGGCLAVVAAAIDSERITSVAAQVETLLVVSLPPPAIAVDSANDLPTAVDIAIEAERPSDDRAVTITANGTTVDAPTQESQRRLKVDVHEVVPTSATRVDRAVIMSSRSPMMEASMA